jgi:hypothetical protein
MDYSTINLDELRRLPTYTLPAGYSLQEGSGNGCSGDAPGYPTYFTRSVYTAEGNNPWKGPQMVITFEGVNYVVDDGKISHEKLMVMLHRLWVPLPVNHTRTQCWMLSVYNHQKNCYNGWGDDMVIYPVPHYKKKRYTDDSRWKDEFIQKHRAEVDAYNLRLEQEAFLLATPTNHNAVRVIRKFYPDHEPILPWITSPPENPGLWWETEAVQPSEEDCARVQRWGHRHPFNGSWCQFCGRKYPKQG